MSRPLRIAVNMHPVPDGAGGTAFTATLPMAVIFEKSLDSAQVDQERLTLQQKYRQLVETLRDLRPKFKRRKAIDSWLCGDAIVAFERDTLDTLLFVDHLTLHLARDVEYGKAMLDLCRRFRLHLPDQSQIDPALPFDAYYRTGFDPQKAQSFKTRK